MSKARKFVIMVLLDTVLRAVPILVNTIRFGAANNLNFFSLVFLRLFSQLLANDISPNNCSIKKLINFAEGIIINPLMSAQPFVFSTCFKRHSFGQRPNSLYLFLKVFTRIFRRIRSTETVHFGRTILDRSYGRFNFSKLHLNLGRY